MSTLHRLLVFLAVLVMWTCVFWLIFNSGLSLSNWLNCVCNFSRKACSLFHAFCLLWSFSFRHLWYLGSAQCLRNQLVSNSRFFDTFSKCLPIVLADFSSLITFISAKVLNTWFSFTIMVCAFVYLIVNMPS